MKKMKIKIFCAIVLLVNVVPLHCMTATLRSRAASMSQRSATSGMHREAAARLAEAQKQELFSAQQSQGLPGRDTSIRSGWLQSGKDWLKSLFQRSTVQSQGSQQPSYSTLRTAPFGARSFSTKTPQHTSWWDKVTSYFEKKLSQKESVLNADDIRNLAWGHVQTEGKDRFGYEISRMVFDKNDLEIAKEKIGRFLQKNPEYKTDPIVKDYEYYFKFRRGKNIDFTVLDIVFLRLFEGDENYFNPIKMSPSDNSLNQIELIKYLINIGAQTNPDNNEMYKKAYRDLLNNWSYQALYESNTQTLYGVEYEIQKFKEIFKELDPILEKIIPGFKNELEAIQKERAEIEANPEIYRKKVEDAENRRAYRYAKARQMSDDYNRRTGDAYASYPHEFSDRVKFDEQEYEQWLRNKNQESSSGGSSRKSRFRFEGAHADQGIFSQERTIWDLLPGLTNTSSKEEIKKEYHRFILENHPDKLPKDMTDQDKEEIEKKVKEVNAAWDAYNDQLKQQDARE